MNYDEYKALTPEQQEEHRDKTRKELARELGSVLRQGPVFSSIHVIVDRRNRHPFGVFNRLAFWAHKAHRKLVPAHNSQNSVVFHLCSKFSR